MKNWLQGLCIAFAMYSKIPMPKLEWNDDNMKYVLGWFPIVGGVIGILMYVWSFVTNSAGLTGSLFASAGYALIPLCITGGIHMDGFMDTSDANASYASKERRLEIMKDSHSGAFAVIGCAAYTAAWMGIYSLIGEKEMAVLAPAFVFARAASGYAVLTFPLAKGSGLAATFQNHADKNINLWMLRIWMVLAALLMFINGGVIALLPIVVAAGIFCYYYRMSVKNYGGITGDLAGWFLCVCEISMSGTVALVAIAERIAI